METWLSEVKGAKQRKEVFVLHGALFYYLSNSDLPDFPSLLLSLCPVLPFISSSLSIFISSLSVKIDNRRKGQYSQDLSKK